MDDRIQNLIKIQLDEIIKLGFSFDLVKVKYTETRFGEKLILEQKPIEIVVTYHKFVNCQLVSLYISRTDKKKAFDFEEYLTYKKKDKTICAGALDEKDEDYIIRFFALFKEALEDDLMEVIKGNIWIEVPKDYSILR